MSQLERSSRKEGAERGAASMIRLALARLPILRTLIPSLSLVAACTSEASSDLAPKSPFFSGGTRLRAEFWDGGEGARQFSRFIDGVTGEVCTFKLPPGQERMRCLPTKTNGLTYDDPGCSHEVVYRLTTPQIDLGAYVNAGPLVTRNVYAVSAVVRRSEAFRPAGANYARTEDGSCVERSDYAGLGYFSDVEARFELESFVGGEVEKEYLGGGLIRRVLRADDGAFQEMAPLIDPHEHPCSPWRPGDAGMHCAPIFPMGLYDDDRFTEATCTAQFFSAPDSKRGAQLAKYGALPSDPPNSFCGPTAPFFVEREVPLEEVFIREGATCAPDRSARLVVEARGPLSYESFPIVESVLLGEGRLQIAAFRVPGGAIAGHLDGNSGDRSHPPMFFDRDRGEWCWIMQEIAGLARCLPTGEILGAFDARSEMRSRRRRFADAACTIRAVEFKRDHPPPSVVAVFEDESIEIHRAGSAIEDAFVDRGATCDGVGSEDPCKIYYTIAERLAPDAFARVSLGVD